MSTAGRTPSLAGRLARLGFSDPAAAERLLGDPEMAGLLDPLDDLFPDGLVTALGETADPDLALGGLVRVLRGLPNRPKAPTRRPGAGPTSPAHSAGRLRALLRAGGPARDRLLAVLGASQALADHLARHPLGWEVLAEAAQLPDPEHQAPDNPDRANLLRAVGADPLAPEPRSALAHEAALDALRVAYYRRLCAIAGWDLTQADPILAMPRVGAAIADLAGAALETALAIARAELPADAAPTRLAVIGLGKCGGRELNYVSDVDVIFVAEPASAPSDESASLATATRLAAGLARACSEVTAEGTLWPVDAGLRPEGKTGPLVRTVASHVAYYERWAATWEFQALLKARVVAGDQEVGRAYLEAIEPRVWQASTREHFVDDVQAMRRRVEEHVSARESGRQLKLGPGGLRDVEFSVQLLQLVHGRADRRLRSGNTLVALERLSVFGYVGRDDAGELDRDYRMLRTLEHRIQLHRLRRTHVIPEAPADLRRLGRLFGFRRDPGPELIDLWSRRAREVRRLHEKLFYRPLLAAAARLSTDEARLSPEAAEARLRALGFRDPAGAMRYITALTSGVSRRAAIQRQLLPVMLGWFADGADPDSGLLAFRRVSDQLGSTHWYLKMLRDSGVAAERMAHVLSASRFVGELLQRGPEAVAMLADDAQLAPRKAADVREASVKAVARHGDDVEAAALAARGVRRAELVRTAIADLVGLVTLPQVGAALSAAAEAVLEAVLVAATHQVAQRSGGELPTRLLIVAMGRLGGHELGYGGDADVMFVHEPREGVGEVEATSAAMAVATEVRRLLAVRGTEPGLEVDPDLRPEGRQGALVRTLDSYAEYYRRWSAPWEAQALLRATPIAGDLHLAEKFTALIDPLRWPVGGLDAQSVREIRRIKARVESERLPRGADPHRHLKLGRGSLSDVEWTVQLLQLRFGAQHEVLRTSSTLASLAGGVECGVLDPEDAEMLREAWVLASRIRNATVLLRGRPADALPSNVQELDGVARIVGYPPASAGRLDEDYQRTTRRSRAVMERIFYE